MNDEAVDGCVEHVLKPHSCLPSLFPYTTLFRSNADPRENPGAGPRHAAGRGPHGHDDFGTRRSEEHTSELQSRVDFVCRLLLEKKKEPPVKSKAGVTSSSSNGESRGDVR